MNKEESAAARAAIAAATPGTATVKAWINPEMWAVIIPASTGDSSFYLTEFAPYLKAEADLYALARNLLPSALDALNAAERELATLKTHSAFQAETVSELNGKLSELNMQIEALSPLAYGDTYGHLSEVAQLIRTQSSQLERLKSELARKDAEVAEWSAETETLRTICASRQKAEVENQTLRAEVERLKKALTDIATGRKVKGTKDRIAIALDALALSPEKEFL